MSDYPKHYHKALQFSADHSAVPYLLSPESLTDADRHGGAGADHTKRGVIADYLQDLGRDGEAQLLRSGRHILIHQGTVQPGRFTVRHLAKAVAAVRDYATRMTGDDPTPWTVHDGGPGLAAVHHPDHDEPEVYPVPEARQRLTVTLRQNSGLDAETGDWTEGWHEDTVGPQWKRLRRLTNAVAAAPIEEIDPTHKEPK